MTWVRVVRDNLAGIDRPALTPLADNHWLPNPTPGDPMIPMTKVSHRTVKVGGLDVLIRLIAPSLVSLVLYVCSENAEMFSVAGGKHPLQRPKPKKTKWGLRLHPPDHPTRWNVAYRLGAALRREWAGQETGDSSDGTHAKPHHAH